MQTKPESRATLVGFFGALTKTMVEEGESVACGVWLIDDSGQRCDLWMAYVQDRLYSPDMPDWAADPSDSHSCPSCSSPSPVSTKMRRSTPAARFASAMPFAFEIPMPSEPVFACTNGVSTC